MANLLYQIQLGNFLFETYDDRPDFVFEEVKQVHSAIVARSPIKVETEADGIISTTNTVLAIKTADCLPIAIIGTNGYANIHAGWRGLASNILKDEGLLEIGPQQFVIGPHISAQNYEVSEEFKQNFPHSNAFNVIEGKLTFSLETEVKSQISDIFPNAEIICANICTFANLNYNSFRRNQTTKRNYNILKRN